jgi:precorrin-2 dehydrogenase/sirohydrochlorin ferrochelatase
MKKGTGSYYPVFLDISGKRCVVVGGGQVAWRKVTSLLENNAAVEVVSPVLCPEIQKLADSGKIVLKQKAYQTGDLKGAVLAIAATDDSDTNTRVSSEGRANSILVNVVDDAAKSDFILPSCLQRGDLTIAVSTSGRSPALARKIRTLLETQFSQEYSDLTLMINEVRSEMLKRGLRFSGDDWQEALSLDPILDLLKKGNRQAAKQFLINNLMKQQLTAKS